MRTGENSTAKTAPWFDPFTFWMLIIMFVILAAIFIAAKYMGMHEMAGSGTDDVVNALASQAAQGEVSSFHRAARGCRVGGLFRSQFLRRHDCGAQLEEAVRERDRVESEGVLEYANCRMQPVPLRDTLPVPPGRANQDRRPFGGHRHRQRSDQVAPGSRRSVRHPGPYAYASSAAGRCPAGGWPFLSASPGWCWSV